LVRESIRAAVTGIEAGAAAVGVEEEVVELPRFQVQIAFLVARFHEQGRAQTERDELRDRFDAPAAAPFGRPGLREGGGEEAEECDRTRIVKPKACMRPR